MEIEVRNAAPDVGDDRFLIPHSRTFTSSIPEILQNDSDVDGDTLTATLVSTTSHGTLTFNSNGTFAFVPNVGFVGTDSFEYKVSDGLVNSNIGVVTLDLRNTAPRTNNQYHRMPHDRVYSVDASSGLKYFAVDPDDDAITIQILGSPSNGTVVVAADGSWDFTPNAGFVGKDTFTYRAFDGVRYGEPTVVTLDVTNQDVRATADYHSIAAGQTLTVAARAC